MPWWRRRTRAECACCMDLVPSHTSIEHPWFREHPEWYIWSPVDGPANNWVASFGGPAWSRDEVSGRWYLHSFYPEQPDLDWRNPEVRAAMGGVVRFWLDRGVDGFRVDAIDRLLKDDAAARRPAGVGAYGLPLRPEQERAVARVLGQPAGHPRRDRGAARGGRATRSWSARCTCRARAAAAYLGNFDAVFVFELFHAPPDASALRGAVRRRASR